MFRYIIPAIILISLSACSDNRKKTHQPHKTGSTHSSGQQSGSTTDQRTPMRDTGHTHATDDRSHTTDGHRTTQSRTGSTSSTDGQSGSTTSQRAPIRSSGDSTPTAGDQSESAADRKITQEIRKAVMADNDLSLKAKNSTIVTIDGVVTLRGTVNSTAERRSIATKADRVSGVRRVDNKLEVAQ